MGIIQNNDDCQALRLSRALFTAAIIAVLAMIISPAAFAAMPVGAAKYTFADWEGPELQIYTYRPERADETTPIMIVMHGTNRDADRYRDEWKTIADEAGLIIAAPEFDDKRFPKSTNYNLGGYGTKANRRVRPYSAFAAIEPLFDDLRERLGSTRETYYLYGHSAGSQFVHRYLYANPDARIETAFAANAGWYTMPQLTVGFPYGLKDSGFGGGAGDEPRPALAGAFRAPLVVMLGNADIRTDSNLRTTPEANAQGKHRYERGISFFRAGAIISERREMLFCWQLVVVPDVGHSNAGMAAGIPAYLAHAASAENAEDQPAECKQR